MAVARFLFVSGAVGQVPPAWPLPADLRPGDAWFAWRLLGANNRELGRSACLFATLGSAQAAAREASLRAAAAHPTLVADAGTGSWSWRLLVDGRAVAAAARSYSRQRECHYNLAQFLTACGTAASAEDVIVMPGPRAVRTTDVEVHCR